MSEDGATPRPDPGNEAREVIMGMVDERVSAHVTRLVTELPGIVQRVVRDTITQMAAERQAAMAAGSGAPTSAPAPGVAPSSAPGASLVPVGQGAPTASTAGMTPGQAFLSSILSDPVAFLDKVLAVVDRVKGAGANPFAQLSASVEALRALNPALVPAVLSGYYSPDPLSEHMPGMMVKAGEGGYQAGLRAKLPPGFVIAHESQVKGGVEPWLQPAVGGTPTAPVVSLPVAPPVAPLSNRGARSAPPPPVPVSPPSATVGENASPANANGSRPASPPRKPGAGLRSLVR